MTKHTTIYRVDKFIVPQNARDKFLEKVTVTHELLKTLPGFVQDAILDKSAGDGEFNIVTIVEWENNDAMLSAKNAVQMLHKNMNFNAREFMQSHNIKIDRADYTRLKTE